MPIPLLFLRMMAAPAGPRWAMWIALALSVVALVFCAILFVKLRRRNLSTDSDSGIPDVLGVVLQRTQVSESGGVRWDVSIYPETLSVPGYVVLTAILQNAYDRPRMVTLEVAPDTLLPRGLGVSIALNGGEAGILRTPLFVSRTLPPGTYGIRAVLAASAPRGEGRRLLNSSPRRRQRSRSASLRVVSAHDRPPVNLFAYDWRGFASLYNPPQTTPDLTEVRILQELPSAPSRED